MQSATFNSNRARMASVSGDGTHESAVPMSRGHSLNSTFPPPRVMVISPNTQRRDNLLYSMAREWVTVGLVTPRSSSPEVADSDFPSEILRITQTLTWYRFLEESMRSFQPHLIHFHGEAWSVTAQQLVNRSVPLVVHGAENVIRRAPLPTRLRRTGLGRVLARVDGYLSWGRTGLTAIQEAGLPPTTPHGIIPASPPDPGVFTRASLRRVDGEIRLIFVGRLAREKGVETILDAMALCQSAQSLTLDIVGKGPLEGRLRLMAEAAGLRVHFHGSLGERQVHGLLTQSDVLVAPSKDTSTWREQWGRCVAEAMATGVAVLVSDGGELPMLVADPDCVFPQNDHLALARRIERLVDDRALLRQKADEAYARSRVFDPSRLSERLASFWCTVIDNNRR